MLLEIAIADAYGAGFEFANANLDKNTLDFYVKHPRHPLPPGSYTDDTQMSIAIAECLLEDPLPDELGIATKFVEAFQRDPREGYAHRFYKFLLETLDGQDFLNRIRPASAKSGAAMRAVPIGLLPSLQSLYDFTVRQARLTHDTVGGVSSALGVALLSHYCFHNLGHPCSAPDFVVRQMTVWGLESPWNTPFEKRKVGVRGMDTVHAAIQAVSQHNSLAQLLRHCVNLTGDVDTVAAIAVGAASGSRAYRYDLPDNLYLGLETGPYGRGFLEELDLKLMERFAQ